MKSFILVFFSLVSFNLFAAPKAQLWSYWNSSNENSIAEVNHQDWQSLLDKYLVVKGQNTLFSYSSVTEKDKGQLKTYISAMSQLDPLQLSRAQQYAYWVNVYNSITVQLILESYPIKSITKLGGLFSFGPWDEEVITINGKPLTLNAIEHQILRPIWNDPRTHYAVNCASLGCPNLQSQAFTADNTEQLLDKAATEFINSEKGVKVVGKVELSSIYDWFAEDFGTRQELIQHLSHYRPELKGLNGRFSYDYNWALNDNH